MFGIHYESFDVLLLAAFATRKQKPSLVLDIFLTGLQPFNL
jgi:hypothetical protein